MAITSNLGQNVQLHLSQDELKSDKDNSPFPVKKMKMKKQLRILTKHLEQRAQQREEARKRRHTEKFNNKTKALEKYKTIIENLLKTL